MYLEDKMLVCFEDWKKNNLDLKSKILERDNVINEFNKLYFNNNSLNLTLNHYVNLKDDKVNSYFLYFLEHGSKILGSSRPGTSKDLGLYLSKDNNYKFKNKILNFDEAKKIFESDFLPFWESINVSILNFNFEEINNIFLKQNNFVASQLILKFCNLVSKNSYLNIYKSEYLSFLVDFFDIKIEYKSNIEIYFETSVFLKSFFNDDLLFISEFLYDYFFNNVPNYNQVYSDLLLLAEKCLSKKNLNSKFFLTNKKKLDDLFIVKVSLGQGGFATYPWISFLIAPNKTSDGIYPCFLFDSINKIFYLVFGVSEKNKPIFNWNSDVKKFYKRLGSTFSKNHYSESYIYKLISLKELIFNKINLNLNLDLNFILDKYSSLMSKNKTNVIILESETIGVDSKIISIIDKLKSKKQVILYGPPGTGKTYYARKIAQDFSKSDNCKFVTFHQSYTYEDFIEGIRPKLEDSTNDIKYIIKSGTFKDIAIKAKDNYFMSNKLVSLENSFETVLFEILDGVSEENVLDINTSGNETIFRIYDYNDTTIYFEKSKNGDRRHTLCIQTLKQIYNNKRIIGNGLKPYYLGLKKYIQDYKFSDSNLTCPLENYVLIIDEINRGNISKIFGELITLLESDKRLGSKNINCLLPYSQDEFNLSPNLYIIATMNTADKSIASLDVAFRRRFGFIEMLPDSELLSSNVDGVDLQKLLEVINNKIEFLIDKDHLIGHSYFMKGDKSISSIDELYDIWYSEIIPLLEEYFYNDYEKINFIIGPKFFIEKSKLFKNNSDFLDSDSKIYSLEKYKDDKNKFRDIIVKIYSNNLDQESNLKSSLNNNEE